MGMWSNGGLSSGTLPTRVLVIALFFGFFSEISGYKHACAFGDIARFPRTDAHACVWVVCVQVVPDKKIIGRSKFS